MNNEKNNGICMQFSMGQQIGNPNISWILRLKFKFWMGVAYTYMYIYILCIYTKLDSARCFSSAYPFVRLGRERKKEKKLIFPVFCGEKVCRNKKNTRAFGQRKIFFFSEFSRFSRGKGMQKQKKTRVRSGRERKKENFSTACVRAEKEKKKIFRFFPFFAGKRSVETIKK